MRVCVSAPSSGAAQAADPWLSPGCKCRALCCPDLGESRLGGSPSPGWCCAAHGGVGWLCPCDSSDSSVTAAAAAAVTVLQGAQLCSEGLDCCQCSCRQGPEDLDRNIVMALHKVTCKESIAWGCASASHLPFFTPGTCFLGYTTSKAVQRGFSCCFS